MSQLKLHTSPTMISNGERVLAAVGTGGFLLVRRDGMDVRGGRDVQAFAYKILDDEAYTISQASDLFQPYVTQSDEVDRERMVLKGLRSLVSFLSAFAEAGENSDNIGLFEYPVKAWAEQHSDELTMLACELDIILAEV